MRPRSAAIVAALLAAVPPLAGQDTTATKLDTVVVSASKSPPGSGSATQSITVVTGEELRASGVEWVGDALRLVPGAVVARGGSFGAVTSLFLRGGETRYTKVLVDGVTVNSVGGYFDFSDLSTENVERIEIVRGPGSVVHGADAMTGVVHVITRRGSGNPTIDVDVRGGSYATRDVGASLSGGNDRLQYSAGGGRYSTDGTLPFNNTYRNGTLSSSVRFAPLERTSAAVSTRLGSARYHYPTDFAGVVEDSNSFRDQRRITVGMDALHRLTSRFELRVLGGLNDVTDNTDDVDPPPPWIDGSGLFQSRYSAHTKRRNVEARGTVRLWNATAFTSGVEYVHETERTTSFEAPVGTPLVATSNFSGRRETRVAFAEVAGRGASFDYLISGRVDTPSDFGTFPTYRLGLGWAAGSVRLRASVGTAFNSPAFSQLLPTEFTIGSPDLDPERARSLEAGFDWRTAGERLQLRGTRFDQRFDDLIQFVNGGPPDFRGSYANLARVRSEGWEFEARALPVSGLLATISFTALHARVDRLDESYDGPLEVGEKLIRRARHSAAGTLAWVGSARGSASVAVRHVGSRPDLDFRQFPSPTVELPAYTVADFAASLRVLRTAAGDRFSATLRVQNLFARSYEEILYYPAPGRTILLGARAELSLR